MVDLGPGRLSNSFLLRSLVGLGVSVGELDRGAGKLGPAHDYVPLCFSAPLPQHGAIVRQNKPKIKD